MKAQVDHRPASLVVASKNGLRGTGSRNTLARLRRWPGRGTDVRVKSPASPKGRVTSIADHHRQTQRNSSHDSEILVEELPKYVKQTMRQVASGIRKRHTARAENKAS